MVETNLRPPRSRTKGKKVEVSEETISEIVSLYKTGHTYSSISELTGYSRWTVDKVLKESRGETMYRSARKKSIPPDESPPEAPPPVTEVSPVTVVPLTAVAVPEVDPNPPEIETAIASLDLRDLESQLSDAVDEAEAIASAVNGYKRELQQLWESATRVNQMREGLDTVLSTFEAMKLKLDQYRVRIEELDQANVERALAVHSEGSLVG